ncbi:MAG: L-2-amino-thiazoline-4-carboxylic acid hydrolase [Clostridia bacterium]|nr:L-2-amino-thiazoline-4-carboxylic acid hydrolase [Clostridia bacterium]
MKYAGMPQGMWLLFQRSFQRSLTGSFGIDRAKAAEITRKAHARYREIIASLPEFEKGDRFKMNIVSCAMLASFLLNLPKKPTVAQAEAYYNKAMMTGFMRWFCRMSGRRKFSEKDIQGMKATAALRAADRNPYSWNMDYLPYADGSGYEARFLRCGICALMKELGLFEYVPAMCRLDYAMSEAGGASNFVREYTLASGGPYCDCGYKRKTQKA